MQKFIWLLSGTVFFILFALIGGGLFISQKLPPEAYIRVPQKEEVKPVIKGAEPESEPGLSEQIQEIIKETEKVITQTQEFVEAIRTAQLKSADAKGLYLNEFTANSQQPLAVQARANIVKLLDETELNAVVIDVKEAYGPRLPASLKTFISELHQKDVWVVAHICVFRDASQRELKPEWYLRDESSTSTPNFWQDGGGGFWIDPNDKEAQQYIIDFGKQAIDFGFDELQFDYVRFPSDGNLKDIVYPSYDGTREKYEVMRDFFLKLSRDLKDYRSSIILSVDLFGYVATQYQALTIGQRLIDAAESFDYLSFMLYPSHFYSGFGVPADPDRQLPALFLPYKNELSSSTDNLVSQNPYEVVFRSVLAAVDYLTLFQKQSKVRPWLQDFNLKFDMERGIFYDAEKIKTQIRAAQDGGASGWLLWNAANVYTPGALF